MEGEQTLSTFTAELNGQVGTAVVTTGGVIWRAAGSVSTTHECRAAEITKFQVSPAKNPKAILRFERAGGQKPLMIRVVLNEDLRCGASDFEVPLFALLGNTIVVLVLFLQLGQPFFDRRSSSRSE